MPAPINNLPSAASLGAGGFTPNAKYFKPLDLSAIIAANVKGWHDLNAKNPGLQQLTAVTSATPGPGGIASAQTTPTLQYQPNPALSQSPLAVAQHALDAYHAFQNAAPDPAIIKAATTPAPGSAPSPAPQTTSWFGRMLDDIGHAGGGLWGALKSGFSELDQGVTHGISALKKSSDDSGGSWKPSALAHDVGALGSGFVLGLHENIPKISLATALGAALGMPLGRQALVPCRLLLMLNKLLHC